jgi:hypothetical protein
MDNSPKTTETLFHSTDSTQVSQPLDNLSAETTPVYKSVPLSDAKEGASALSGEEFFATENFRDEARIGLVCPNCGSALEGRKCKLFCTSASCGYLVTCSEW